LWAAGVWVLWQAVAWNSDFLHDDAYITLRYAQNWLAGDGISWNPGERVEGYTNFLQLLLVTGLGAVGVGLVQATRIIALIAWSGLLGFGLSRAAREPAFYGGVPVVVTAASIPLVAWCFGGLEAPLVALLLTLGTVWMQDALRGNPEGARPRLVASGVAFGLACLARLDAGIFVAAGLVFLLLSVRGRGRVRVLLAFVGPVLLLLVPWLAWKATYYGSLLPNTWYVKAADPSGWRFAAGARYVLDFVAAPPFPLLWLSAGAIRAALARRLTRADGFALCAVALSLGWVLYVGGDQMPAHRLLVPLVPVSAWAALALWRDELATRGNLVAVGLALAISGSLLLQLAWPGLAGPRRNATSFVGEAVGRHIGEHFRPGSLVALNTAGSTPFHAPGLRYLDMLGLNDAHIARRETSEIRLPGQRLPGHAKGDGAYVLSRRPDYIILGPAGGVTEEHPWFLSDLEIVDNPAFSGGYRLRVQAIDARQMPGWERYPETASGALRFTFYERQRP
jgi:hypothetical protein